MARIGTRREQIVTGVTKKRAKGVNVVKQPRRVRRRVGPRNTLVESDPFLAEVKARLAARGHTSLRDAAESVGFASRVLTRILREGLSPNPQVNTVERLKKLGIYELVAQRGAA